MDRTDSWVQAMGAPNIEWAANDLMAITRELDEAAAQLARVHDLIARAEDRDLLAEAATAHTAASRLVDGLAAVASELACTAREVGRG